VQVHQADYGGADARALAGVDRLLLISGTDAGERVRQHANVMAAVQAVVRPASLLAG
jgi:NAD(P)H dehydrogenase (quinone)